MSNPVAPPILADNGLRKIHRHAGAVYPLEAYGFLIGLPEPVTFTAALPVGKTSKWHVFSDRFARISAALESARRLAASLEFEILGLYHSHSDASSPESPLSVVPPEFRESYICINITFGGEVDLFPLTFHLLDQCWSSTQLQKKHLRELPRFNPRRIHSAWIRQWTEIDYSNGRPASVQ